MLEVKNLSSGYNNNTVINNINLTVKKGQLICLLGPNGSGKTTILKCLNGILAKNNGVIYIDNKRLTDMKRRDIARIITYIPQEHNTVFSYTVLDFITMGVTPYLQTGRVPGKKQIDRACIIMKELNIQYLQDRNYDRLSGGEKRLVLIARALMQDTDYLVFDEPTSHLDFKNRYLVLREIRNLTSAKKGVIIALHDPNLALKFSDRVVIIKDGSLIAAGRAQEVINSKNLEHAYEVTIGVNNKTGRIEVNL